MGFTIKYKTSEAMYEKNLWHFFAMSHKEKQVFYLVLFSFVLSNFLMLLMNNAIKISLAHDLRIPNKILVFVILFTINIMSGVYLITLMITRMMWSKLRKKSASYAFGIEKVIRVHEDRFESDDRTIAFKEIRKIKYSDHGFGFQVKPLTFYFDYDIEGAQELYKRLTTQDQRPKLVNIPNYKH